VCNIKCKTNVNARRRENKIRIVNKERERAMIGNKETLGRGWLSVRLENRITSALL
jgi:hypothetical protein